MASTVASSSVRHSPDDRYTLSTLLGRGAMGEVWRGQHVLMKRAVAIKFLTPEVAGRSDIAARFMREAQALSQLDHPNICRALDFGEDPAGGLYLVMEFVEGETLGELLEREGDGGLDPDRAFEILRQMVVAIAIAHENGIVHRDLKPDNVMLTTDARGAELVKLMDFGIAKINTPEDESSTPGDSTKLTKAGTIFGTPAYMAPEQAVGQGVNAAADVYAAGSILYEMLTGWPPFDGDSVWELLRAKLEHDPEPLPPRWPPRVRDLVARMMSRVPEQRPSIAELEAELEAFRGDALRSAPPSRATRSRMLVAALVVVALAILLIATLRGGDGDAPELEADGKGLEVLATTIAPRLSNKEPDEVAATVKPTRRLFCHVAVKTDLARSLTLAWSRDGQPVTQFKVRVKPSLRYRTWARFKAEIPGRYRCDVRNSDGAVLGSSAVEVSTD